MSEERLSPMIALPYRDRTIYIPQQSYGSESVTPDLMVRIEGPGPGGAPITSSTVNELTEFSRVNTYNYDVRRDIHSAATGNLYTNAQVVLSDVTFVMPAEGLYAEIVTLLLQGTPVPDITFVELQNHGKDFLNVPREKTIFRECYFTHLQRFTTSWAGGIRINLIICSFRASEYDVSVSEYGQDSVSPGNKASGHNFKFGKPMTA